MMITNTPVERALILHPYVWWDDSFSESEQLSLSEYFDKTATQDEQDVFLTDETQFMFGRFNSVVDRINHTFFSFDLLGYKHMELVRRTQETANHGWRMDAELGRISVHNVALVKKLTIIYHLNQPDLDFEGGELLITDSDQADPLYPEIQKNRIIAFPSFMIHKFLPVTKGASKVLKIHITGPKFR